jgi:hypothetical protein
MPKDELETAPSIPIAQDDQPRRPWEPPAVTRLDVVETTLAKDGPAIDGAGFDLC